MAARFCSQCGQELSSAARFCPNCAAPVTGMPVTGIPGTATEKTGMGGASPPRLPRPSAAEDGPPMMRMGDDAPPPAGLSAAAAQKSRRLLIPSMIAALIVLAIAVAVLAGQSHRQASLLAGPNIAPVSTPAVTNAPNGQPLSAPPLTNASSGPGANGPALTNAPTGPPLTGPGMTNAPNTPAPTLPPDVAAYLTFLKGIETRRVAMNNDVSGAMGMLGAAQGMQAGGGMQSVLNDPEGGEDTSKQSTQKLNQGYDDYALKWQGLIRDFRAMPAPPACGALAALYLTFLSDYTTVITKMQVALLNHNSQGLPDLSAVASVQAQVNTDGAQADSELGNLCAHYGVSKPFVISPEGAAPSLLGH